jgi:hypothetical protein
MKPVEVATTRFAGGKRPNIILPLADELRADAVHCIDGLLESTQPSHPGGHVYGDGY